MEIDINQQKIAIGSKYKIFVDQQQKYTATKKLFQLLAEINLFDENEQTPRMRINRLFDWFRAKYDITRQDQSVLEFRTVSFWKLHYRCNDGADRYDIFGHRGRKYSVFKNDVQVAWWTKKAVTWFAGDNYKIIADSDADVDLIISFCLLTDNFASKSGGQTITIDVGHIGPQARKFDENWRPKY